MSENQNHKEIEVVTGDGSNLDISPVYEHLNATKPKMKSENPKDVIIPKPCKCNKNVDKDKADVDESDSKIEGLSDSNEDK